MRLGVFWNSQVTWPPAPAHAVLARYWRRVITGENELGQPVATWQDAGLVIAGVRSWRPSSGEAAGQTVERGAVELTLPPGHGIQTGDRVEIGDVLYDVVATLIQPGIVPVVIAKLEVAK